MGSNKTIIGRKKEITDFNSLLEESTPKFIAFYGRRRVGKTYLIREYFKPRAKFFEISGTKDSPTKIHLEKFQNTFQDTFYPGMKLEPIKNWREAFSLITKELVKMDTKKVLFIDELPWLASPKSNFLEQVESFWNSQWSQIPNLVVIVCGSAASWMIKKIINNKGGLHNRLTHRFKIEPFTLAEVNFYLKHRGFKLNKMQTLEIYLTFGGIPYYLSLLNLRLSLNQNIQKLFFTSENSKKPPLKEEFSLLFESLFDNSKDHLTIIKLLGKKYYGLNREEIIKNGRLSSGGGLTTTIDELVEAGFITQFISLGRQKKEQVYRLTDEFSRYWIQWIRPLEIESKIPAPAYWNSIRASQLWNIWYGLSFECLCLKNAMSIANALNIFSIVKWYGFLIQKKDSKTSGLQIDLLFERTDNAITLCEIKSSGDDLKKLSKINEELDEKAQKLIQNHKTFKNRYIFKAIVCIEKPPNNQKNLDIIEAIELF
jgi:AAA+ ATPase superfamily predicted ATPase